MLSVQETKRHQSTCSRVRSSNISKFLSARSLHSNLSSCKLPVLDVREKRFSCYKRESSCVVVTKVKLNCRGCCNCVRFLFGVKNCNFTNISIWSSTFLCGYVFHLEEHFCFYYRDNCVPRVGPIAVYFKKFQLSLYQNPKSNIS